MSPRSRSAQLRFVLIGALLYGLQATSLASGPDGRAGPHIVVSAEEARALGQPAGRTAPLVPALRDRIDEELLWREGLRLGLDRDDPVVRQRLLRNQRFAAGGGRDDASPDALLAEARRLGMHRSDTVVRRRVVARTLELLARRHASDPGALRAADDVAPLPPPDPRRSLRQRFLGESPLPLPETLGPVSQRELAARFGPAFASAVFALEPDGRPHVVASAYGAHRVEVAATETRAPDPAHAVTRRAARLLARREAALAAGLAELRAGARVEIAWRD